MNEEIPQWAHQLLYGIVLYIRRKQAQMNQLIEELQSQMNQLNQMTAEINPMHTLIRINSQRSRNYARRTTRCVITVLMRVSDGQTPRDENLWFPADQNKLFCATRVQVDPLLAFYGLDLDGNLQEKRNRLAEHLGVVV